MPRRPFVASWRNPLQSSGWAARAVLVRRMRNQRAALPLLVRCSQLWRTLSYYQSYHSVIFIPHRHLLVLRNVRLSLFGRSKLASCTSCLCDRHSAIRRSEKTRNDRMKAFLFVRTFLFTFLQRRNHVTLFDNNMTYYHAIIFASYSLASRSSVRLLFTYRCMHDWVSFVFIC